MAYMFDLDQSVAEWRRWIRLGGFTRDSVLDELENHLREDVEQQVRLGLSLEQAFANAGQRIGPAEALHNEFRKIGASGWNRKLASLAWGMFFISFFLPSYGDGKGWKCALLQPFFWSNALHGRWCCIHYELLTLANLLMLASPFVLFRFGGSRRALQWLHRLTLIASVLVWTFIGLFIALGDGNDLRLGCFVWGLSFPLLYLCGFSWSIQSQAMRRAFF